MSPVILTLEAIDSLDEVTTFPARRNQPTAFRFLTAVEVLLERLGANPDLGMHIRVEHPRLSAIRWTRLPGFRKYLAIYSWDGLRVVVLLIVHRSRNWIALLSP
jgi:plasmid stabilization system protein ParE